jgi:hypothetical protein
VRVARAFLHRFDDEEIGVVGENAQKDGVDETRHMNRVALTA